MATPESVLSGVVEEDGDGEGLDERERLERTARAFSRTADRARRRLDEIIPQSRSVQQLGIVLGIGTDKAAMVKRLLEEEDEREIRLAQSQAEVIVSLFPLALEAAGVPVGPLRPVLGELLRRASEGGPLVVSPAVAEPAYAAVRDYFGRIVREELEAERRALPPGPGDEEVQVQEADVVEPDAESPVEEIADAEVVPKKSIEEQASEMTARIMEKMRAQAVDEQGFGVGWRESPGTFDARAPGF